MINNCAVAFFSPWFLSSTMLQKQYFPEITTAIFSLQTFVDITTAERISTEYFHWSIIFVSANENNPSRLAAVVL